MSLNTIITRLFKANNFDNDFVLLQQANILLNINELPYPIILIGGTNGKGSVCAYLSTILINAGFRVGTFTSPHVLSCNERICINNKNIDDLSLENALQQVINACNSLNCNLGFFTAFTLASHIIFKQQKIDIAIVEVGIGGKNDITNLFEPLISAITNVELDHKDILGDTLDKIGLQKSGIYRKDKWAFFGNANISNTVIESAQNIGTKLQILNKDFILEENELSFNVKCQTKNYFSLPYPGLRGIRQKENAALAIAILDKLSLKFPVSLSHIKTGLLQATLIGRFQVLPGLPQTILDVAHNPHAVTHMLENMLKLPAVKNSYAVFGLANDKDLASIIFACRNKFDKWFIAKTNSRKSLELNKISEALFENGIDQIVVCKTITDAYNSAKNLANGDDGIVCFGSFYTIEEVHKCISS